jgi:glycosyltransferase involved in cell wall biosynthesis
LEAAACGTPVVASRTGAIPDILGDAARYVDPKDVADIGAGMVWAATELGAQETAERSRERVASLTWKGAVYELLSDFRAVARA